MNEERKRVLGRLYNMAIDRVKHTIYTSIIPKPMANPTKLEELTKRIQELVPDIMELKPQCKVTVSFHDEPILVLGLSKCHDTPLAFSWEERNENNWMCLQHLDVKHIDKILGRDIQLADVLLASPAGLVINSSGELYKHGKGRECWQLAKPLHFQSPECLNFLHSILCQ